jgi:hypothetical protein
MIEKDVRTHLKNLDDRLARVEQFLPSVATKDELNLFATKDDLREESERTRRHMDDVLRRIKEDLKPLTEAVRKTILCDG